MTLSNQEVPEIELFERSMYDFGLSELNREPCFFEQLDTKPEDSFSDGSYQEHCAVSLQQTTQTNTFNSYPSHQIVPRLTSPSVPYALPNSFIHRPFNTHSLACSTYSRVSPLQSPQQTNYPTEDFLLAQRIQSQQIVPQSAVGDYRYYYGKFTTERRRKRDEELTHEEYEKRRLRRERNKQAALRCRTRRRERIDALEQETDEIEKDNNRVENEIMKLERQVKELKELLKEHQCDISDSTQLQTEKIKREPR